MLYGTGSVLGFIALVAAPCFWLALRARLLPALPEQDLDEHDERRDRGNEEGGEAP